MFYWKKMKNTVECLHFLHLLCFFSPWCKERFLWWIINSLFSRSASHLALRANICRPQLRVKLTHRQRCISHPGGRRHPFYRPSHLDCNSERRVLKHQFISSRITHKTIWLLSADCGVIGPTLAAAAVPGRRPLCCLSPGYCDFYTHTAAGVTEISKSEMWRAHAPWQPPAESVFSLPFHGFQDNMIHFTCEEVCASCIIWKIVHWMKNKDSSLPQWECTESAKITPSPNPN